MDNEFFEITYYDLNEEAQKVYLKFINVPDNSYVNPEMVLAIIEDRPEGTVYKTWTLNIMGHRRKGQSVNALTAKKSITSS